jgi:PAS domain S-box-containing protein
MTTDSVAPAAADKDGRYSITDLIPLEKLQYIQDAFAKGNNVASSLTDTEGQPITMPSNHSPVCVLIRATEKGLNNCIHSGKQLGIKARQQLAPIRQRCFSIGFSDAVAPVIVNGRHIANWLIGQYHVDEVDEARVRQYALEIGADPEAMTKAFQSMLKHSAERFDDKLTFLGIMANEISQMGYQNLVERRQTAELIEVRKQLEQYQEHLEYLVEERTTALRESNQQLLSVISQKTKMQKRQNRLVTAIESAAESIIITSLYGKIIYINPAFTTLTGYSRQELIGRNPRLLKSGHQNAEFYYDMWQAITTGRVWKGRFVNKKKDGTIFQDETTISPVIDDEGTILNFVAVKRDITKEIELETQLRQAQRMEAVGTLAAGVAHEMNSPIQYILSNTMFLKETLTDLLKMQAGYENLAKAVTASATFAKELAIISRTATEIDLDYLKEETGQALEEAIDGIKRISTIVAAMKDFSQPGSTVKQPGPERAYHHHRHRFPQRLARSCRDGTSSRSDSARRPPAGREDQADPAGHDLNSTFALTQKYGNRPTEKGTITIATGKRGNQVALRIADTGAGIPANIIDKIFDPFFTTKPVGQGRGQGLSVVHGVIVDNHGGSIRVASTIGKGTEFTIMLPLETA